MIPARAPETKMLEHSVGSDFPPEAALDGDPPLREAARLEELLAARARERRELHGELVRTTVLLRDALARFAELPVAPEPVPSALATSDNAAISQLREEREAAVSRALEAEASRAETAFRLDEALGHLLDMQRARDDHAALLGTVRGLRARAAEVDEALGMAQARLLLVEQDLADANERTRMRERAAQEASERFELELLRARGALEAERTQAVTSVVAYAALRGERDGLAARMEEGERALAGATLRARRTERALKEALDKLSTARAEHAEQQILNQAQAAQLDAAATHHTERAQLLRRALGGVRHPLQELSVAVHDAALGSAGARAGMPAASEVTEEPSLPDAALSREVAEQLERKLKASERRVEELESMLAGRMAARDPALSTLKGEIIDVRANATRLADDLSKERARRRKVAVTVRALQAATESGEDPAPWIDELVTILNEGASVPPARP